MWQNTNRCGKKSTECLGADTFRNVDSAKVDSAIESWRDSTVVIFV
jgi:hypothetical protein